MAIIEIERFITGSKRKDGFKSFCQRNSYLAGTNLNNSTKVSRELKIQG